MASRAAIVRTAIDAAVDQVAKRIVISATHILIGVNPVETGHSRNNWIPSVNTPYPTIDGSRPATRNRPVTRGDGVLSDRAQKAGLDAVASAEKFTRLYVTNNVEYIQPLNFGHSQQAPAGYVQAAIAQALKQAAATPLTIVVRVPEEPKA